MEAAAEAVNCLNKGSLTELKNFKAPPAGVDLVTGACLMMIDGEFKNMSWERAKKMMAKVDGFLDRLKKYNAETMPEELIAGLSKYIDDPTFNVCARLCACMSVLSCLSCLSSISLSLCLGSLCLSVCLYACLPGCLRL